MANDGTSYYEMVIIYVDDVICISKFPEEFMKKLSDLYKLKDGYYVPKSYLGMDLSKTSAGWLLSSQYYLINMLSEWEKKLKECNIDLPKNVGTPLPSSYQPETDDSKLLDSKFSTWYQALVGTLRWIVEIGRIDI